MEISPNFEFLGVSLFSIGTEAILPTLENSRGAFGVSLRCNEKKKKTFVSKISLKHLDVALMLDVHHQ